MVRLEEDFEEIVEKVIQLYREGNFGEVASLLEEYDIESFDVLVKKIYSFSLIRLGEISKAERVLEKLFDILPEDPEVLNALAYVEITKGNKTAALNYLLDAEYYATGNVKQFVRKNIDLFSEIPNIEALKSVVKPRDFLFLTLPEPKKKFKFKFKLPELKKVGFKKFRISPIVVWGGGLLVGVVFFVVVVYMFGVFGDSVPSVVQQKISKVEIDAIANLVEPKPILTNEIVLTDREIVALFNELKVLISRDRTSNKARFIANYLLHSNASTQVKNKVEVLKTFIEEPEISLDWQPLYEEVNSKPILYDGVYVVWRGKVVNVSKAGDVAEFTFVIHGRDESIVKGFIRARMKNFLDGYIGQTISVLGRISSSKGLFLEIVRVIE